VAKPVKQVWTGGQILAQLHQYFGYHRERDVARAEATRDAAGFDYIRGDLHIHTRYSDGSGTVPEVVEVARQRGLDFIFVTDHDTVRQKLECRKYHNVWWGQEPGGGAHHICILGNDRKYTACQDMARDASRLRELGYFFYYPHPTGWYPNQYYRQDRKDALAQVGKEFAMEVLNGVFRVAPFNEEWVDSYVALWDRYLRDGYRVTGLGGGDSHLAAGVGNTWTGVLDTDVKMEGVIETLRSGCVFASTGPAINITCGRTRMGGVSRAPGANVRVRLRCADSYGIQVARLIRDGRTVREFWCKGKPSLDETVKVKLPRRNSYVRAECVSVDDRHAYANPIYFRGRSCAK